MARKQSKASAERSASEYDPREDVVIEEPTPAARAEPNARQALRTVGDAVQALFDIRRLAIMITQEISHCVATSGDADTLLASIKALAQLNGTRLDHYLGSISEGNATGVFEDSEAANG